MTYYFSRRLETSFGDALDRVGQALKRGGFGIISEIDVRETLKAKLGVDYHPYRILGACNPRMAFEALQAENKIGTMLPCNVIVQKLADGCVEVAAIDPVASMRAVDNPALAKVAETVRAQLRAVIDSL